MLPSTLCYRLLRTVHCIYSRLSHYRPTRTDYCTSLRQCRSALLSQLLLSLKLLPPLHSCRSSIVRVKRYSYASSHRSLISTHNAHPSYIVPRSVPLRPCTRFLLFRRSLVNPTPKRVDVCDDALQGRVSQVMSPNSTTSLCVLSEFHD
jgi:hypothetical protein